MKDKMGRGCVVVHLGAGAQILYTRGKKETPVRAEEEKIKQKIKKLQDRLDHRLVALLKLSKEINSTLIILLDPHTDLHPIYFKSYDPPNFNITSLSKWAISVASKYPDVIIWDYGGSEKLELFFRALRYSAVIAINNSYTSSS